jgi:hypothetical protein
MHAFLHSLEVILAHQRRHLARLNLDYGTNFSRLWIHYDGIKEVLIALTRLCRLVGAQYSIGQASEIQNIGPRI